MLFAAVCVSPFALLTEFAQYGSLSDVIGSPPVKAEASQCAFPMPCGVLSFSPCSSTLRRAVFVRELSLC